MKKRDLIGFYVTLSMVLLFAAPAAAAEWRAWFNHIHTIYSLDNPGWEAFKPSVAEVIERADRIAASMAMEAAVLITDHRTIDAYFDPGFHPVGVAWPIKGEEWGGSGHAGAMNFDGETRITEYQGPDRYSEMVEETHSRGGIAIANHPKPDSWKTDRRLGVDGIEVWNTVLWSPANEAGLAWWQRLLSSGEQVTAVGGSDSHFRFLPIETPWNLVWCESNEPDDVVSGIVDGRVIIVLSPGSPRIFLEADTDGDDVYDDAMVGDVLAISDTMTIDFQVRIECGDPSDRLILADRDGVFHDCVIGSDDGWDGDAYRFSRDFSETARNFVRAELRNHLNYPQCITNPIYAVGDLAPSGTEGEVAGSVRDASSGALLDEVEVTVAPGEYSTDVTGAEGAYSIILPNGFYEVTAQKSGYWPATAVGFVVDSDVAEVDFELLPVNCFLRSLFQVTNSASID